MLNAEVQLHYRANKEEGEGVLRRVHGPDRTGALFEWDAAILLYFTLTYAGSERYSMHLSTPEDGQALPIG